MEESIIGSYRHLNQQSEQYQSQQQYETATKVITQGAASFYSFGDENNNKLPPITNASVEPTHDNTNNDENGSLNVLNFNKMKIELQQMFELGKLPDLSSPKEDEQLNESESSMLRETLPYNRNVLFQSLIKSQDTNSPSFTEDSIVNESPDSKDNTIVI